MSESKVIKKTFSLPHYLADRLDEVSSITGFSQSNMVFQALASYLHQYEQQDTRESWLYHRGLCSGGVAVEQNINESDNETVIDW